VKPCSCGTVPQRNYSIRTGESLYCPTCRKLVTRDVYAFDYEPVIEWVHGAEALPPKCPFCRMPPKVGNPESEEPLVFCGAPICPLYGKGFTLKEWNQCRPEAWTFERLLKRWKEKPGLENVVRALQRAIKQHQRGRFLNDG